MDDVKPTYPGIGRAAYFGLLIVVFFFSAIFEAAAGASDIGMGLLLVSVVVSLLIGASRYKNIGYSPALILFALIPLVNIFIAYQCLALPPGYASSKTWDVPMRIVTALYVIVGVLVVLAILTAI